MKNPLGMLQPQRTYNPSDSRYGFNGKENDLETGWQDYGMRMYDPRVSRFFTVDPVTEQYPELTPYQFASNMPIKFIDLDGLEATPKPEQEGNTFIDLLTHEVLQEDLDPLGALKKGAVKVYDYLNIGVIWYVDKGETTEDSKDIYKGKRLVGNKGAIDALDAKAKAEKLRNKNMGPSSDDRGSGKTKGIAYNQKDKQKTANDMIKAEYDVVKKVYDPTKEAKGQYNPEETSTYSTTSGRRNQNEQNSAPDTLVEHKSNEQQVKTVIKK